MMELTTGNISTIATWTAILITGLLAYFGIEIDMNALLSLDLIFTFKTFFVNRFAMNSRFRFIKS